MKRKLINLKQVNIIECDGCDYVIPNPTQVPTIDASYIDKPCPVCGANLCTQEDYLVYVKFLRVITWVNKYFSWLTWLNPARKMNDQNRVNVIVKAKEGALNIEKNPAQTPTS